MCFNIHPEHKDAYIVTEEIVVWKSFSQLYFIYGKGVNPCNRGAHTLKTGSIGFKSYHQCFKYLFGKTYKIAKSRLKPKLNFYGSKYIIEIGFHSFIHRSDSYSHGDYSIKCYIPVGAHYYYNPQQGHYVSSSIRISDDRKEIKTQKS